MHFKFILIYLGVPSFRTSLLRLKKSLNSVGHSAKSPRQVPLSLHLSVGFLLQSLTRTSDNLEFQNSQNIRLLRITRNNQTTLPLQTIKSCSVNLNSFQIPFSFFLRCRNKFNFKISSDTAYYSNQYKISSRRTRSFQQQNYTDLQSRR